MDVSGDHLTLVRVARERRKMPWTKSCQEACDEVKKRLTTTLILKTPNWTMEFHVHCDASHMAIKDVFVQNLHGDKDFPIHYASRPLNNAEKNCSTTEREALAMTYLVGKIRHYLLANHFVFYVDHQAFIQWYLDGLQDRCFYFNNIILKLSG